MTTINGALTSGINAALLSSFAAELGKTMTFGAMRFSLGSAVGGSVWAPPEAPRFLATMPSEGKANIDIGDGYTLSIDEASSEIVVKDADGNATRVWGDPHVQYNGKNVGDFWGTMTLQLENGTKITINTQKDPNGANVTYANQVVVTRGDQALIVDGVSQITKGDLSVSLGGNGYLVDAANDDGLVINENDASKSGWSSDLTGADVSQTDFDLTRDENKGLLEGWKAFDAGLGAILTGWLLGGGINLFAGASLQTETSLTARFLGLPTLNV
jgi:hypothetical protein